MPKNSKADNRSTPVDVAPPESLGVIAAWQGLYHAFGARFEGVDVSEDGLVIRGFSTDGQYNPETLIRDVNVKNRRVQLFPTILWINGVEPEPFTTPQEMTAWQVNNFKGSVDEGSTRTPKYARDAFSALKASMGIASKRGPKPKTINLKNLDNFDASVLRAAGVPQEDLQKLIAIAQSVVDEQAATTTEVATS